MLAGINYLHAKCQINILKNKKVIKLLELWTLWLKKGEKENSENKRVVITTLKRKRKIANHNSKNRVSAHLRKIRIMWPKTDIGKTVNIQNNIFAII